ncbi:MAG: PAS domain S-box protein [Thermoleophilia bacterium]
MSWLKKTWGKIVLLAARKGSGSMGRVMYEPNAPKRARQKSLRVLRDLIFVFLVFAIAFALISVLDLHGSFEAASLELKDSPFQYDELIVALAILAAALSVFAMRRWRELETEIVERVQIEQALVDSEERYRTLAESAQDFIFIADRKGTIIYLNSYAAGKLGNTPESFVGKNLDLVFPPEMAEVQQQELKKVFADGEPLYVENMATLKGVEVWLSTSLVPIKDEKGAFEDVLGISRDITQRKLAEDALSRTKDGLELMVNERTSELENLNQRLKLELSEKKLAEERLQAVNRALRTTMAASQALTSAEGEKELLYEICKAIVEVGGYRFVWVGFAEQSGGKAVTPVASAGYEKGFLDSVKVAWDDGSRYGRGPVGKAIRSGEPSVVRDILIDDDYTPWRGEATERGYYSTVSLPLVGDGGKYGALNIYASEPDAFDEEEVKLLGELAGDLSYGISALRTRGERDEQAVTLRRTGEQLSLLLESLPIIFYTSKANDDFGVTYVSGNVTTFTGYQPEDLTSDSSFWIDHIHPDDAPRAFEEIPKVFDRGFHEYEYRWRGADGTYKWFLDIMRLVRVSEGDGDYIVGMWLDITARKHGEEQLLKVKGELEEEAGVKDSELLDIMAKLKKVTAELDRRRRETAILNQMDELLQSCLLAEEAYVAFSRFAGELTGNDSGSLYIMDQVDGRYKVVAGWGESPPPGKEFGPDDCWSLRSGQVHLYAGVETGMKCRHETSDEPYLCVPVRVAGRSIGVLVLNFSRENDLGRGRITASTELASAMAARIGMVVYNLGLRFNGLTSDSDDREKRLQSG